MLPVKWLNSSGERSWDDGLARQAAAGPVQEAELLLVLVQPPRAQAHAELGHADVGGDAQDAAQVLGPQVLGQCVRRLVDDVLADLKRRAAVDVLVHHAQALLLEDGGRRDGFQRGPRLVQVGHGVVAAAGLQRGGLGVVQLPGGRGVFGS